MMVRMRGSEVYLRPTAFRLDKYNFFSSNTKKIGRSSPAYAVYFLTWVWGALTGFLPFLVQTRWACQDGWMILASKIIAIVTKMMMMMVGMMMVMYKVLAYLNMSIYLALRRLRASLPRAKIIKGSLWWWSWLNRWWYIWLIPSERNTP